MRRGLIATGLLVLALGIGRAQALDTKAPQVSEDAKRAVSELQIKAAGLVAAQAVLQKELDATQADFARIVQRLQAQCATVPGYELSPALTCVAKKDDPKKDSPPK